MICTPGNIPPSWLKFKGLFHLDVSSNNLIGTVPEHIGDMTQLSYLFLANNSFTPGSIPESFAKLTNMEEFSMKRTRRTGVLPTWLPDWKDLILLDLDQNNFMGEIPASYGNMTNLQFLLLNRNNIGGELPSSFSRMTSLRAVFLERNAITGSLGVLCDLPNFNEPEGDVDGTEIIAADCEGGTTASVVCTCCKICCIPSFGTADTDEGVGDEETCHDATAIANLDPIWERIYRRTVFNFGTNNTRFIDRSWLGN